MSEENSLIAESPRRRSGLLRDQVQLVKKKDSSRYEIAPIQDPLSFEKGFFVVIRACQLLVQKNEGILLVGVAGPSGAGKTVFTDKVLNFMPSIAVITMDNYNDATRIVDGNFDDPRLTDYNTLLENIHGLKEGRTVEVPIYDFKSSSRIGYRTLEVPSSRIVIIEGIYALSEKLRPLLDLRVSVTGGVHFDLVKRVLRDIQRVGQEPEEIIHQISETVYPMYKAFIEPDLQTAHIKIINKFNPFSGFQNPSYILKEWVTDSPFIISPRITFEVSVRLLGGLMALGYTIAAILKRSSHIFFDEKVCVKTDWLEQLNRTYVQTLPDDLKTKLSIDDDLVSSPKEAGGAHSLSTRERNLSKLTKLSINSRRFDGRTPDSPAPVANQGVITHLSEQISTLNERMDDFTSRIEELTSKFSERRVPSHQNMAMAGQAESCNGSATSLFMAGLGNGSLTGQLLPNSASSNQLARESPLMEEVLLIARGQRQVMHQIDNLSNLLREYGVERSQQDRGAEKRNRLMEIESFGIPFIVTLTIGGLGFLLCRSLYSQK
ncbi:Phosphoribulokinase/uridine kinase [Cynara cardunculus var. scolymus]|uniref:Phosphoribulokinase/uridine kinase n=1 Tax=Cynara cardunculus var. scolymus TaxID=59895 RepID=A0A124SDZ7_CYNCS|nr:Phosphoribulokinase/uridine kinase [Cynara cardunculus var. scolymus]